LSKRFIGAASVIVSCAYFSQASLRRCTTGAS
jgi:hypothetical protein